MTATTQNAESRFATASRLSVGDVRTYIEDYDFNFVARIPPEAALAWVKALDPNMRIAGSCSTAEMTIDGNIQTDIRYNGWLNKAFVIVEETHARQIAICNRDGKFSLYEQRL